MENIGEEKKFERFYLDVWSGKEAYLEVNWCKKAKKDNAIKIVIGKEEVVVEANDLETVLLAFTKRLDKFARIHNRKMGLKYIPVPAEEYKKWKKHKEHQEFLKK